MKQESQEYLSSLLEEQKNKELLIKDLCSRLPYGVKIRIEYPFLEEEEVLKEERKRMFNLKK